MQQWQNDDKPDELRNDFTEKDNFTESVTDFLYNFFFRGWNL